MNPAPPVLDYQLQQTGRRRWLAILLPAAGLGVTSGVCWFFIGQPLENLVSQDAAWFICPAIAPAIIAVLLAMMSRQPLSRRALEAVVFFVVWLAGHFGVYAATPRIILLLFGPM